MCNHFNGNVDSEGSARFLNVAVNNSATDLLIGAVNGQVTSPSEHFHGLIDELELFNRALSASEINTIFAAVLLQKLSEHERVPAIDHLYHQSEHLGNDTVLSEDIPILDALKPTVSPLLLPVTSHNLLFLQSLPHSIPYRQDKM
jgi:hypothetical protein